MKFCVNCGKQIKSTERFCTYCGAKQPEIVNKDDVVPNNAQQSAQNLNIHSSASNSTSILVIIGIIVVIILGIGGKYGYDTYQRNHLSQQQIADMGFSVANHYFDNEVNDFYSKANNTMDIRPKTGTTVYNTLDVAIYGYPNEARLDKYKSQLKKVSNNLNPKMPTSLKGVEVRLMNPENNNRYLYIAKNGKIIYDFEIDD